MEAYQQLEIEWARFNDLDPAGMVACSSGTAAIHLALEALQLPRGSEVLTGDFNMIAVPRAITLAGLTPVFVDCDERLLMDPALVTDSLKVCAPEAFLFVHIYGRKCDIAEYPVNVGPFGAPLWVIEDLAEAHGVRPHTDTDAACWSFYRNKIVAGEEGGAVWFRDPEHAKLARQLRCLGFTEEHDFTHIPRGANYRLSNANASLILESLEWARGQGLHSSITLRREIEAWYDAACPAEWRMPPRDSPWVFDLRIKGMSAAKQTGLVKALNQAGVAARHAFKGMSTQEEYKSCRFVWNPPVPQSLIMSREVIYLPINPATTTQADCVRSFDIIRSVMAQ